MKNTNFSLNYYVQEVSVSLQSSSFSYCMFIGCKGLHLNSTGYPQDEIDYNRSHNGYRLKILGVDTL